MSVSQSVKWLMGRYTSVGISGSREQNASHFLISNSETHARSS